MKIVINTSYGGFGLSKKALTEYATRKGQEESDISVYDIARDDPDLVQIVEDMGPYSFGSYSALKVVEIPDDVSWIIENYDRKEWISEVHRTWD